MLNRDSAALMRSLSVTLLLLLALALIPEASMKGKNKESKKSRSKLISQCSSAETRYGNCVPKKGDCGDGLREATCEGHTQKIACRIHCNWKKNIGDCKYKFSPWGACDTATDTRSRSGTLKKVLFNADCQKTITVSTPCFKKKV